MRGNKISTTCLLLANIYIREKSYILMQFICTRIIRNTSWSYIATNCLAYHIINKYDIAEYLKSVSLIAENFYTH